jgi:hypothetical protein
MSTTTNPRLQTNPAATRSTGTNTNPDNDTDLATSLLSPKQSRHHPQNTTDPSHGADRAMSHTGAWKPAIDRRQSWDAQEYKHDQLKQQYMGGGDSAGGAAGKAGFSEV